MRSTPPTPPIARQKRHEVTLHGDTRVDEYDWLRDPGYPEVTDPEILDYLERENRYTDAVLEPVEALQQQLFEEIRARIKEDDCSVPSELDGYWYYARFEAGRQYALHCRREGGLEAPERILLDENTLAGGLEYMHVHTVAVSSDHRLIAYSIDTDGTERYRIRVVDLVSGVTLPDLIENTNGTVVWAEGSAVLFYVRLDDHLRPRQVFCHVLGDDGPDPIVYAEPDPGFFVNVAKTRSRAFILIHTADKVTSEVRFLPADRPAAATRLVLERRRRHEYHVTHHRDERGERFYILTNDVHRNFRVVTAPPEEPERWEEFVSASDDVYLAQVEPFRHHLVLYGREGGLPYVGILDLTSGRRSRVTFPDPTYSVHLESNPRFDVRTLRLLYESPITPRSVLACGMDDLHLETLKVQEIPCGYDRARYACERRMATAPDGARVPISLVYRKDLVLPAPLYLYGYGSYGRAADANFSVARLSLLDRGFVAAIAHVRGGDELGYQWYEDGKLLKKENTFKDFIACAEHLIASGYTASGRIAVAGGSAGGMLIGVVINEAPHLFHAAVAHVPFVDCLNTMLDPTLPLTVTEFTEWGDPRDPSYYHYIKSYSPYDNVKPQAYPHLIVTSGISDPRVTYWEPAKWVARLRAMRTDRNLLLLKTHMTAGHAGPSGRFAEIREVALEYAFLLLVFDKAGDPSVAGLAAAR